MPDLHGERPDFIDQQTPYDYLAGQILIQRALETKLGPTEDPGLKASMQDLVRRGVLGREAMRLFDVPELRTSVTAAAILLSEIVAREGPTPEQPASGRVVSVLGSLLGVKPSSVAQLSISQAAAEAFIDQLLLTVPRIDRHASGATSKRVQAMRKFVHSSDPEDDTGRRTRAHVVHTFHVRGFPPRVMQAAFMEFMRPSDTQQALWRATFPEAAIGAAEVRQLLMDDPPNYRALHVMERILGRMPPPEITQSQIRRFVTDILVKLAVTKQTIRQTLLRVEGKTDTEINTEIGRGSAGKNRTELFARLQEHATLTPDRLWDLLEAVLRESSS